MCTRSAFGLADFNRGPGLGDSLCLAVDVVATSSSPDDPFELEYDIFESS